MYISSHTVSAAHTPCSAPTLMPCISRGLDPPPTPSLFEMFWKVQACWCEFLTCYSSSWKPKINKKRRGEICAAPAGSDRVIRQRPIKRKSVRGRGKKTWRFKKICKKKKQPSIIILPEHPHKTSGLSHLCKLTDHHRDDESLRSRTTWTHPCTLLPLGWCSPADELCWFWFGALGWAHWIKWHRKHTGNGCRPSDTHRCLSATLHTYQRHSEASGPTINTFMSDPDLGVRRHSALDGWSYITATADHFRPPKQSILCTVDHYMSIIDPRWLLGTMELHNHRCY